MNGMNRLQQLKHTDRMYAEYRKALDNADMEAELKKHAAPKIMDAHRTQLDEWVKDLEEAKRFTNWYHEKEDQSRSLGNEKWYQEHSRRWNNAQSNMKRILDEYEYFFTTVPEGAGLPTNKHIKHRYNKPNKEVAKYRAIAAEVKTYNGQWMKEWLDRGGEDFISKPRLSRKV